jgi:hypothetical protein
LIRLYGKINSIFTDSSGLLDLQVLAVEVSIASNPWFQTVPSKAERTSIVPDQFSGVNVHSRAAR